MTAPAPRPRDSAMPALLADLLLREGEALAPHTPTRRPEVATP